VKGYLYAAHHFGSVLQLTATQDCLAKTNSSWIIKEILGMFFVNAFQRLLNENNLEKDLPLLKLV
jgi:hypothetical protein